MRAQLLEHAPLLGGWLILIESYGSVGKPQLNENSCHKRDSFGRQALVSGWLRWNWPAMMCRA
jgi:hypothetical protein